jgi:hypothetical protein
MIEGRQRADAHEFLGADLDYRNAQVIMKMRDDRLGHTRIRVKPGGTIAAEGEDS